MNKLIGSILILLSVCIIFFVMYSNSTVSQKTRTFSPYTILSSSWEKYKGNFMTPDGRVLDHSLNDISTSEGQSYALLRSVWIDDKETFDTVWKWTRDTMGRPNDALFGWKWGEKSPNEYGFLANGGENSASDADTDIALALIFAGNRWGDNAYTEEAKKILQDLWEIETADTPSGRYMIAGNWAQNKDELIVNPSYFAPYAWRIFAKVDTKHDWNSLIGPAYALLEKVGKEPLDTGVGVGLPPDWVKIKRSDTSLSPTNLPNLKTEYSYDAVRTPWRIALDFQWNKDERAKNYLTNSYRKLSEEYETTGMLGGTYSHDGKRLSGENPVMYATALGYFMTTNPELAKKIYEEKIIKLYSNDTNTFNEENGYYEQNWLWFGAALYNNQLISL